MGEPQFFLALTQILERIDVAWTFLLLLTRYTAFMMLAPGLGGGMMGLVIRYPGAVVLALATLQPTMPVSVPPDMGIMTAQLASEVLLGLVVALIPMTIVAGASTAGHLASSTMGLNGAQLVDPSTQTALPDLARIYSDFAIVAFLLVGGHYIAIAELAGLGQAITPGTFMFSATGLDAIISQTARIFQIGCLISAPVIVALLLTNFVMGIISKAVPTINIFIISFPLTIAVGLDAIISQTARIFQIGCLISAPVIVALLLTNFVMGIISKAVPTINIFIISFPLTIAVGLFISILALPEVTYLLGREYARLEEVLTAALR